MHANPERGEMTLVAGDRTYLMKWTTNACCVMEGLAKQTFDELNLGASRGSVTALRWLLWAALQKHHGQAIRTADDVGDVIDAAGGVGVVMLKIIEFSLLNQDDRPEAEKGGPADPPSAEGTNGGGSSSTPDPSASRRSSSGTSRLRNSGGSSPPADNGRTPPASAMSASPG